MLKRACKYQEKVVAGESEEEMVNAGEWCELMVEP